jgi:hypothetical protein
LCDAFWDIPVAGGHFRSGWQMSDFSSQLFSYLPEEQIKAFSCGHVIPVNNLQTLVLTQGPRKTDLVWKFDRRGNKVIVCMEKLSPP